MKCPNCGNPEITYDIKVSKLSKSERVKAFRSLQDPTKFVSERTDFNATCKKCGWKGEVSQ